jgi:putative two-component system response regulator
MPGRIAAIADVFDALTSDRVYRRAVPFEDAVEHMRAERGLHLDPGLLHLFLSSPDQLHAIRAAHPDPAPVV